MRDDGLLRIAAHPREGSQPSLRVIRALNDRGEGVAGRAPNQLALLFFRAWGAEVIRLRKFEVRASRFAGGNLDGDWVGKFIANRSNVKIVCLRREPVGREGIFSIAIGYNCDAHRPADAFCPDQDSLHRPSVSELTRPVSAAAAR